MDDVCIFATLGKVHGVTFTKRYIADAAASQRCWYVLTLAALHYSKQCIAQLASSDACPCHKHCTLCCAIFLASVVRSPSSLHVTSAPPSLSTMFTYARTFGVLFPYWQIPGLNN